MKTANEVYESLTTTFEENVKDSIQTGSVIDIFNKTIADECGDMYQYIEDNKNPYLFTNTFGEDLDSLGYWVNLTREDGEIDEHYKYRLKDWLLTSEASNTTAITNSLLNPQYASNIQYVPYTHGSGTGTCYIIPKVYEEETISAALEEAADLLKDVISPSLYVEYLVPSIRAVRLHCFLVVTGNESEIKANITAKIRDYINAIAPGDYLEAGEIIRLGINESGVQYFNLVALYIDEQQVTETSSIQELETKFLFDNIVWSGAN